MVNKYIGSSFDDFLQEQDLLGETASVAVKRVIAWQLAEVMKAQGITKSKMAIEMATSRSQLDRILSETGEGMTLETMGRVMDVLGLRIRFEPKTVVKPKAASRVKTSRSALKIKLKVPKKEAVVLRKRA